MKGESVNVTLRSPQPGDWGWILQKHGEVVVPEFNFDSIKVESFVATSLSEFIPKSIQPGHGAWIAEANGLRLGCVMVERVDDAVAKLRLLLVIPEGRGMGVGSKLVNEGIEFAKKAGYSKIVLLTTTANKASLSIYYKFGFKLTENSKFDWFGPDQEGVFLELVF